MDKKPLIVGSLCAAVLLVLSSLSNVVGYQSMKSNMNDSPLFQTRTQRATSQQQTPITSRYLGIGKEKILQFPSRDNRTVLIQKIINIIQKMDDNEFTTFQNILISHFNDDDKNIDTTHIILALQSLRSYPKNSDISLFDDNKKESPTDYTCPYASVNFWKLGCIAKVVLIILIYLPLVLLFVNICKSLTINFCES